MYNTAIVFVIYNEKSYTGIKVEYFNDGEVELIDIFPGSDFREDYEFARKFAEKIAVDVLDSVSVIEYEYMLDIGVIWWYGFKYT